MVFSMNLMQSSIKNSHLFSRTFAKTAAAAGVLVLSSCATQQLVGPFSNSSGELVVLHVSDLHGQLRAQSNVGGGYARVAKIILDEKAKAGPHTDVLAILGGDAAGKGAMPCRKTNDEACFAILKQMGFDLAVLGNGEVKRSASELNNLVNLSQIPWLSPNIRTSKEKPLWQKDFLWKGPKTGGQFWIATWTFPPSPGEIDVKQAGYVIVDKIRPKDIGGWVSRYKGIPVIWAPHQELEEDQKLITELCKEKEMKNLVLLQAHTHVVREDRSQCIPIFEAGAYTEALSKVVFKKTGARAQDWELASYELIRIQPNSAESPQVKSLVEAAYQTVSPEASEVVAQVRSKKTDLELGQWLADSYKKVAKADIGIVNSGSIKLGVDVGPLNRERLLISIPYINDLMGLDMGVKELEKALCASSARSRDSREDFGSELILAGAKIVNGGTSSCRLQANKRGTVKIVLDSFLIKRSKRWLGKDLSKIAFKFGMNTEQVMNLELKRDGGQM